MKKFVAIIILFTSVVSFAQENETKKRSNEVKLNVFNALIFNSAMIYSQSDWVNYLVKKDKGFLSVYVDLGLYYEKPNYKNVLIVGSKCDGCMSNGFPNQVGLDQMYTFSDSVSKVINRVTKSKLAGILTYQCYGLDVFYVKDTVDIRKEINRMISDKFSKTSTHIMIKSDGEWDYYYHNIFIFPRNAPNDFFTDHQYLGELVAQGDDLEDPRLVTHWAKFKKEKRMVKFIKDVKIRQFSIDSLKAGKDNVYPFEVEISRKDKVDPKSINTLTNTLKVLASIQAGVYEGWGTEVIIKEY